MPTERVQRKINRLLGAAAALLREPDEARAYYLQPLDLLVIGETHLSPLQYERRRPSATWTQPPESSEK